MYNTKCGCPDCKGEKAPTSRGGWKSRKNRYGNPYGSHKNPTAHHGGRRQAH
jgi:hypothetical protein